jgi:hypothetical protein
MPTSITTAPGFTMSRRDHARLADRGHQDVGLARHRGEVARLRVAHGDGGAGVEQQQRHRLADDVRAPTTTACAPSTGTASCSSIFITPHGVHG